jgi:contact-dependent growth inhibition (CDI) system CdiA-like toxin
LLIHELTHVVQHDHGRTARAKSDEAHVADPNGPEEREASAAAHAAEPGVNRAADSLHEPSPSLGSPVRAQSKSSSSPPRDEAILRDPLPGGAPGGTAAVGQLQALFARAGVPVAQQQLPQATLTIADATRLFNAALRAQPSLTGIGPRMVAARLVQDVIMSGVDTNVSTVAQRLSTFGPIIILRPDGYIARALTGEALQRAGRTEFVDGTLRAGGLSAGTFYYSDGGVFYRADDSLRRAGPPIGELGLEHDAVNSALDGAADALVAMAAGLYQLIRHPIQSIEALTQLPGAVAQLIRNAPSYWELFRAMPLNDQIREVSKLVTTLVTLYGSAAGATTRIAAAASDLGNVTVRALTLSNTGELAWATVSVPVGTVATALSGGPGAVYVLHMTNSSLNSGGSSGGTGGGSGGGPGRLIVPAGRTLSAEETAIANQLVAEGHTVEALAESTTRTADFLVDGVRTELKSISNITSPDPSGALGRRILDGAGQAPNIIADVRAQADMTEELARRAARRAYGADSAHRIQSVRLIGQGFDVTIPRITTPPPVP